MRFPKVIVACPAALHWQSCWPRNAQQNKTRAGLLTGSFLSPLQGLKSVLPINPGRCLGLSSFGLSAPSISAHQRSSVVEESLRHPACVSLQRGELRSFAENESAPPHS